VYAVSPVLSIFRLHWLGIANNCRKKLHLYRTHTDFVLSLVLKQ
jgi:hypothetical protein